MRRFIPARAGNGGGGECASGPSTVHPRACGERLRPQALNFAGGGSSPRVRGTGTRFLRNLKICRFIPARAGNGPNSVDRGQGQPVHPRACGERDQCLDVGVPFFGSSPRVRGTGIGELIELRKNRFIPARAGNGWLSVRRSVSPAVHPRACGERSVVKPRFSSSACGSSPRVRGTARHARRGKCRIQSHQFGSSPRVRGTVFLQIIDKYRCFDKTESHRLFCPFSPPW